MKVQRNIGAVLTVAMLGSIFAGCGSSAGSTGATATQSASTASTETAEAAQSAGSTASAEGGDSTTGYQVTGSMTYNMFMRNTYVTWIKDQKWYDEAEKRTDINNRRYEYPVMMQAADGTILAAYTWGNRSNIKFVSVSEAWVRGAKECPGAEDDPSMPGKY